MDADIAASPRILTTPGPRLSTGKGLTEANPSPYRASDTVSGWAIWEHSHRVQPYGKDRPGKANLGLG